MAEIQELREIVQAQAQRVTMLTRLAERIGYIVEILAARDDSLEQFAHGTDLSNLLSPDYPFTIIGERERRAAQHEAEGPPVTREDCVP